ncbi:hypothetical protein JD844_009936 [Phrynosoma platyrhinos]|uniref:FMN hydroxy acid dehydrogenase domain-containing protein n=1 Tax=Phrynosoma platyrhinos TaxID=52577 RepID=A0ABQ7TFR7_PHRPL|nr:hypothetical protein JD844_009936 [Phrynosoma platyrhinos]
MGMPEYQTGLQWTAETYNTGNLTIFGEETSRHASEAMNTCYIASTYSTCSMEEIAAAAPSGVRWFQLYIHQRRDLSEQLVRQMESLGFQALVLTADLPSTGKRRDDLRNTLQFLSSVTLKNFNGAIEDNDYSEYGLPRGSIDPSISWKDIAWLKSLTHLPLIIKGILTKEDAKLAVRYGVQGIIVSNHGGRQLDGVPATGEKGLQQVLKILKDEFRLSMALAGCRNVSEIDQRLVQYSKL